MFRTAFAAALLFASPAAAQQLIPDQTAKVERLIAITYAEPGVQGKFEQFPVQPR